MQLSELQALSRLRFKDLGQVILEDADWLLYLNAAYRDFLSDAEYPVEEAEATLTYAANAPSAALPAGATSVRSVVLVEDDEPLFPIEGYDTWQERYPDADERGAPEGYFLIGSSLHLRPTTNSARTVRVITRAVIADLAAAGDTPVFPAHYHHALVSRALELASRDHDRIDASKEYATEYADHIRRARNEFTGSRTHRYARLRKQRVRRIGRLDARW